MELSSGMRQSRQAKLLIGMRCYFNLVSGSERIIDPVGIEVDDLEHAWVQALKAIEELRAEDSIDSSEWANWRLEATDETGSILFSISLGRLPD